MYPTSYKHALINSLNAAKESREHPDPWNFQLAQTVDHFRHKQGAARGVNIAKSERL